MCAPVAAARWDGATLSVRPSRCGRGVALTQPGRVLAIAARRAGTEPSPTLRAQLRCHAYFAGFKREWNLEAARPHVSWPVLIATACNPPVG